MQEQRTGMLDLAYAQKGRHQNLVEVAKLSPPSDAEPVMTAQELQ